MGIIRKTMSVSSLGAVDYRSDKERTAAYTKGARKQAKKQTKIMEEQAKRQAEHNAAMLAAQSGQALTAPQVTQGSPTKPHTPTRQEIRAQHPEWDPANVDITKNPMLAKTTGEALAIRKARRAAKRAQQEENRQETQRRAEAKVAEAEAKAAKKAGAPAPVASQSPPPGWYPDQVNPALVRWFDGQNWTDHLQTRQ